VRKIYSIPSLDDKEIDSINKKQHERLEIVVVAIIFHSLSLIGKGDRPSSIQFIESRTTS